MEDRVEAARRRCASKILEDFARAGLTYPAETVLCRGFKNERELELWATNEPGKTGEFRQVQSYPILGISGAPGPKRREGDRQVPEGFYRVTRFNPRSRFHLSLGLDYPNASDLRLTTDPQSPGSDIFIHGGAESRGCLAMGDTAMEEIYLAARDSGEVHVHLFPHRLDNALDPLFSPSADATTRQAFWRDLWEIYRYFEEKKRLPVIRVDEDGRYRCEAPPT